MTMGDPRDWIAATLLPGIGPVTLHRLRQEGIAAPQLLDPHFEYPSQLSLRAPAQAAIRDYQRKGNLYREACRLAELAERNGWHLLTFDDARYPQLLREIADPPALLWLAGAVELPGLPQLAVVGSRHASRGGVAQAYRFCVDLAAGGLVITSGLARGIDAAAHQAAVDQGRPTLAVLGTGLDIRYPRANTRLAAQILDGGGTLLTEYPPGTRPLQQNFPRRNRIISGLSVGTLVVEAALKSGSLITARQALEQGREVFALPGSIHNPMSRGCHALIREGALLVESSRDILAELAPLLGTFVEPPADPVEEAGAADPLLAQIPFEPLPFDHIAAATGMAAAELQTALMRLELEGKVELRGGYIQRIA
jgi:DNA processing protein